MISLFDVCSLVLLCLHLRNVYINPTISFQMTEDPEWPKGEKVTVSRRQVAAIAFLANIRVEEEAENDLPGLHCLRGTEVLENYRCVISDILHLYLQSVPKQDQKDFLNLALYL